MSRPAYIRFLSRAAPLYDVLTHGMGFRRLWDTLAERIAPRPGLRCLDACTGTGGVALALARRGARVVGVDAARGMLAEAAHKLRSAGLEREVRLVRMDARQLCFPDGAFPLVTCSMALHEMAEQERAAVLAELRRVSSERVVIADYRVPTGVAPGLLFRARRIYEYLESDDFAGYVGADPTARLAAAALRVEEPWDAGAFRIWPCRIV